MPEQGLTGCAHQFGHRIAVAWNFFYKFAPFYLINMMKLNPMINLKVICAVLFALMAGTAYGQFVRSSFFMDGAQYRMQINPALAPDRGYVHVPAVSNTSAWAHSNVLDVSDMADMAKNIDDPDYYITDDFYPKLKDRNEMSAGAGSDLVAAGWWHGKGFMSFSVSVKADGNISAPLEMFSFMRDMRGMNSNDYSDYICEMRDVDFNVNSYAEIAAGYTRQINDRLSVGGRVKGLLGIGNFRLKADRVAVITKLVGLDPNLNWSTASARDLRNARGTAWVEADAHLESSFEGLELVANDDGYIETMRFRASHMGLSGMGAAFDFGVAYEVANGLTLSAALNDLGFIRWYSGCTQDAYANTADLAFDSSHPGDIERFMGIIGSDEPINMHLLRLTPTGEKRSRTTSIASTITLGGEYRLLNDKLGFGALYSHHNVKPSSLDELTLGVNLHPADMLDFALTYSPILCGGKSFGLAMKLGPLYLGTDYIYLGNDSKGCNAIVGLSIPLGKRPE